LASLGLWRHVEQFMESMVSLVIAAARTRCLMAGGDWMARSGIKIGFDIVTTEACVASA